MKKGLPSIILSLVGMAFVLWYNYLSYQRFYTYVLQTMDRETMHPMGFRVSVTFRLIAVAIGLVALALGISSLKKSKTWGWMAIVLSIVLLLIAFIPLWTYFWEYSGLHSDLDINFYP